MSNAPGFFVSADFLSLILLERKEGWVVQSSADDLKEVEK